MRRLLALGFSLVMFLVIPAVFTSAQDATATPVVTLETYTVRSGDTLLSISRAYGVSTAAIARQNALADSNIIRLGQVLLIPASQESSQAIATNPYTVVRGDTLSRIATRFNTTTTLLLQLNRLTNPNVLPIGLVLRVPADPTLPIATPTTPATLATPEAVLTTAPTLTPAPLQNIATATAFSTVSPTAIEMTPASLQDIATSTLLPASESTDEAASGIESSVALIPFGRGIDIFISGQSLDDILAEVAQLDVEWVRMTVNWRDVEITSGTLNLDLYDEAITTLDAQGRNILLTLTGAPDWARPSATEFVLSLTQYGPPDNVADFGTFAGQIADRYAGIVDAYEIWSEPNLRRSWLEATTTSREDARLSTLAYVDLLRAASESIRAIDPDARIISAGLAPTGLNSPQNAVADRQFLRNLLGQGLLSLVDGVGVEPDGFANPPDALCCEAGNGVLTHFEQPEFYFRNTLADYRALLLEFGGEAVALWPTRFGWGIADGNTIAAPNMDENPFLTYTDEAEQAAYTLRAYELGQSLGYVGPMFLYNLNGCVVQQAEACFYSLLTADGQPREAGIALGLVR